MAKEIKIGDWYYRMMGYGGSDSRWCCVMEKTGEKTGANLFSVFGGVGGGLKPIPVAEVYLAIDELGREFKVSANDLKENGHIGIGTLEPDEYGHKACIYHEDANLLIEKGKYTKEEIEAEFPFAFKDYDEEEKDDRPGFPMTAKQAEILKAAFAANEEKKRLEKEEHNRKFREAVEENRKKYSYIPCPKTEDKYLRTGEVSRNLKAVLKHEFPGVKFSVTSDTFSGGDSATVKWVDGPAYATVDAIVDAFQINRHDYTGDYWDPCENTTTVVCGGFSYTHANREYTPETRQKVEKLVDGYWPKSNYDADWQRKRDVEGEAYKILQRTTFPVGAYEIEGLEFDEKKYEYFIKFKEPKAPTPPPTAPRTPKGEDPGNAAEIANAKREMAMADAGERPDNGDPAKGEAYWKRNTAKKGIEIYFPSMPSEFVRSQMKANGFRWHRGNRCWYNRFDEGTWELARCIVMEFNEGRAVA